MTNNQVAGKLLEKAIVHLKAVLRDPSNCAWVCTWDVEKCDCHDCRVKRAVNWLKSIGQYKS